MYGNVDYVAPVPLPQLPRKRSLSDQSNIYLEEDSIYEPVRGSDKPDPHELWRLSSVGSSGEETILQWSQQSPQRSCHQRRRLLLGVLAISLVLILILTIFGVFMTKYSAMTMKLASLREEQRNRTVLDSAMRIELAALREAKKKLIFLGSFLLYNEDHNKCAAVRTPFNSSSHYELTASTCSSDSYSQLFHWLPGGRLMSAKEGLCVGVLGKPIPLKPLRLLPCDTGNALSWVCTNVTLLGIKGMDLYFNYGNTKINIVVLYSGTKEWSRWRAQSLDGQLQDGGACAQSCE